MLGLLNKDSRTIVNQGKLIFIFILIFTGLPGITNKAFAMLFTVMVPITAMNADRACKWDRYASTALPLSSREIVFSKYAMGYSMIVLTYALSTIMNVLSVKGLTISAMLEAFVPLAAIAAIYLAVMIPVIYEVASDKGSLVYLVTTLALVLVSALNQKQTTALLYSLNTNTTMLLSLIAAAVVINIISVEISARIFNDRVWK
ncbi:MAG: ABC-2 transporter permease [Eubacteriaceae bacterium]|jgi:hypothetical protein|nr:ABC-2 transporter permease [Eubacteriaceae bacterium]